MAGFRAAFLPLLKRPGAAAEFALSGPGREPHRDIMRRIEQQERRVELSGNFISNDGVIRVVGDDVDVAMWTGECKRAAAAAAVAAASVPPPNLSAAAQAVAEVTAKLAELGPSRMEQKLHELEQLRRALDGRPTDDAEEALLRELEAEGDGRPKILTKKRHVRKRGEKAVRSGALEAAAIGADAAGGLGELAGGGNLDEWGGGTDSVGSVISGREVEHDIDGDFFLFLALLTFVDLVMAIFSMHYALYNA